MQEDWQAKWKSQFSVLRWEEKDRRQLGGQTKVSTDRSLSAAVAAARGMGDPKPIPGS
ncbi:hypothetical protein MPNT_690006 [Candidatus Methylacidithermus pantelleriae]|uniref:Uncharacterized protein n=1 Tax=Candidatus Methylacidithermus pantelleriae TaxID=2744239 RepID=A0A8J2BW96_9BACT|nr:hypothetical protein MPNT_690006 [Candidatus Methylacidithermus pantelleriae]